MSTTISEEAVKAAAQCYLDRAVSINETASSLAHAMLTAALPFLSALETYAARELALEEVKTSGATDVRGLIKTYANAAFEQQGKDIPKYIWHLHFEEFATAIRALSSPDPADAGKVEGDGWKPIESAPKDGTIVLLGWNDPDIEEIGAVAGWYEGGPADKCWYDQYHEPVTATHWMPLRPLPSAPSEGAE